MAAPWLMLRGSVVGPSDSPAAKGYLEPELRARRHGPACEHPGTLPCRRPATLLGGFAAHPPNNQFHHG